MHISLSEHDARAVAPDDDEAWRAAEITAEFEAELVAIIFRCLNHIVDHEEGCGFEKHGVGHFCPRPNAPHPGRAKRGLAILGSGFIRQLLAAPQPARSSRRPAHANPRK